MKLSLRWLVFAIMLLFIAVIILLAIVTQNNNFWLTILTFFLAALGVVGTFSQWLFPVRAGGSEESSNLAKRSAGVDSIIVDPYKRQMLEEQRTHAIEQENKVRRKKRNRIIISVGSAAVVVLSVVAFFYLQLQPQISFITSDSDYGSRVTSVAWSPNGKFVASATQNGNIRVWNVTNGGTFYAYQDQNTNDNTYNSTTGNYNSLAWSPDGKYIAFGDNDSMVRIVEISNKHLSYIHASSSVVVNTVVWSPSGTYIAFGGDNAIVYVAQFSSKKTITTFPNDAPLTALAWSRDGKLIASGGIDGKIHVWNTLTGKNIFNPSDYGGKVTSLAWSPTSSTILVSGSSDPSDSQVHIWDTTKGDAENPIITYRKNAGGVNGIAWSPDGKEIASVGNGGTLRIWDVATGYDFSVYQDYLHSTLSNTDIEVSAVGWSSDGKSIAIGHNEYDKNGGYNYYFTVKVIKFCRSWCLFQ